MSDTEVAADSLEPIEEADLVDGAEAEDIESEEDIPFIDIDQFRDHYVTVKVDGDEVRVPLAEAVAGYQRQADYTRKTQELAQQRAEVQWASAIRGALENDPQGAIRVLAEQFGVQMGIPTARPQQEASIWDEPMPTQVDPRYAEIEARLARFEEERAQQELERTINTLQSKYGDDFDPREVVAAALAAGSTDLEATFKQIKFDKVMAEAQAAKAAAAKAAGKQAAKRDAAVVSGGSAAGQSKVDAGSIHSIADAWREAKAALGG